MGSRAGSIAADARAASSRGDEGNEWSGRVFDAQVKWFDHGKGFGFVVVDGLGDVYLHKAIARSSARETTFVRHARFKVRIGRGPKGLQVVQIVTAMPSSRSPHLRRAVSPTGSVAE